MSDLDIKQLKDTVRQYVVIKDEITNLTNRQNSLKKQLQDLIKEHGEVDSRGHIVLEVNDEVSGITSIKQQRRVSKSLDMDVAENIIEDKNLEDSCIVMVPTIDEEAIMAAFYAGKLTEADIDAMFPEKVTYAFVV